MRKRSPSSVLFSPRRPFFLLLLAIALSLLFYVNLQTGNIPSAHNPGLGHLRAVSLDVQPVLDFTISAKPQDVPTILANSPGTSTIYVNSTGLFIGKVDLTVAISPSSGIGCTLTPPSVTLGLGVSSSQISSLSCEGSAGSYKANVTATSPTISHSVVVSYIVQDFLVSADPLVVPVNVGALGSSNIMITAESGFGGTVSFGVNNQACSIAPATLVASGLAKLTCSFASVNTVKVNVTATSGTLSRSVFVTFNVGDFSINGNPANIVTTAGQAATTTVTLTNNGFNGQVTLNAGLASGSPSVPGLAISIAPDTLNLVSGISPSSVLQVNTTAATPAATYNILVTCTNCAPPHSAAITLVLRGNFTMTLSKSQLYVAAGSSVQTDITVTSAGLNEILSLTAPPPIGATGFTPPPSFSQPFIFLIPGMSNTTTLTIFTSTTTHYGVYTITASGTDRTLTRTIRFNVTVTDFSILVTPNPISISLGGEGNSSITVIGLYGFNGTVTLAAFSTASDLTPTLSSTSISLTSVVQNGNSTLFVSVSSNTFPGVYTVKVKGTSGIFLSHTTTLTISVVEFGILVLPIVSFQVGTSQSTPVQIISHGFQGLVTLSIGSVDPSNGGLTATIVPKTVRISPDVSGSAILSLSGITPGRYYLTINGTSGTEYSLQHLWVFVGDFTISSNTPSIILVPGGSRSFTLAIAGEDNFAGTITLNSTSDNVDLQVVLNHSSVTLAQGHTLNVTITITAGQSARSGTYTIIVSGYVGQLSHSITISAKVAYPPSMDLPSTETVNPGIVLTFYINVTDSDPGVTLSSSPLPSGASFVPTYRTGTISVVTGIFNWKPSSSQSGDYVITFTAQDRNGGVTTRQVTVHVNSVNRSISLPPLRMILYGLIVGAGVIVTLVGSVVWRQKKLKASPTSTMPR